VKVDEGQDPDGDKLEIARVEIFTCARHWARRDCLLGLLLGGGKMGTVDCRCHQGGQDINWDISIKQDVGDMHGAVRPNWRNQATYRN
jgi:hypothetical protein